MKNPVSFAANEVGSFHIKALFASPAVAQETKDEVARALLPISGEHVDLLMTSEHGRHVLQNIGQHLSCSPFAPVISQTAKLNLLRVIQDAILQQDDATSIQ